MSGKIYFVKESTLFGIHVVDAIVSRAVRTADHFLPGFSKYWPRYARDASSTKTIRLNGLSSAQVNPNL